MAMAKVQTAEPVVLVPINALPAWGAVLFAGVWALLFGLTIQQIYVGEEVRERPSKSIGTLASHEGTVQFRPADNAIWNSTARNHPFYDGDMVATGDSSHAVVRFADGRELEIAENSQIALRTEADKSSNQYGSIVTLLRGTLAARSAPTEAGAPAPLRILSGGKVFTINKANTAVDMEKTRGASVPLVKKVRGTVEVQSGTTRATIRQEGNALMIAAQNPADQASVDSTLGDIITEIKGFEAALRPLEHTVFWVNSVEPNASQDTQLSFELTPPAKKLPKDWAPALKLASLETPTSIVAGRAGESAQKLVVPLSVLLRNATMGGGGPLAGVAVGLSPGARLAYARAAQSFQAEAARMVFHSLQSLPAVPVLLQVQHLAVDAPNRAYLLNDESSVMPMPTIALHFKSGRDFAPFASLLPAAGTFRVEAKDISYKGGGLYFVRDGVLIGSLQVPKATNVTREAVTIAEKVRADILYRGDADAFLPIPKDSFSSAQRLKQYIGTAATIYVLAGTKVVRVNSSFIEKEASVVEFIARAGSVFLKPVEIVPLAKGSEK